MLCRSPGFKLWTSDLLFCLTSTVTLPAHYTERATLRWRPLAHPSAPQPYASTNTDISALISFRVALASQAGEMRSGAKGSGGRNNCRSECTKCFLALQRPHLSFQFTLVWQLHFNPSLHMDLFNIYSGWWVCSELASISLALSGSLPLGPRFTQSSAWNEFTQRWAQLGLRTRDGVKPGSLHPSQPSRRPALSTPGQEAALKNYLGLKKKKHWAREDTPRKAGAAFQCREHRSALPGGWIVHGRLLCPGGLCDKVQSCKLSTTIKTAVGGGGGREIYIYIYFKMYLYKV